MPATCVAMSFWVFVEMVEDFLEEDDLLFFLVWDSNTFCLSFLEKYVVGPWGVVVGLQAKLMGRGCKADFVNSFPGLIQKGLLHWGVTVSGKIEISLGEGVVLLRFIDKSSMGLKDSSMITSGRICGVVTIGLDNSRGSRLPLGLVRSISSPWTKRTPTVSFLPLKRIQEGLDCH